MSNTISLAIQVGRGIVNVELTTEQIASIISKAADVVLDNDSSENQVIDQLEQELVSVKVFGSWT